MITFDKKRCLANIYFLAKEKNIKIGDLESAAGVSAGYLSRINKDDNETNPSIDFIVRVADALNTSIDTLINIELTGLTPTERYLISFIDKLKSDTSEDKLEWERSSADYLNRLETDCNGYVSHPLFSYETFYEKGEGDYPDQVSRVVFLSHTHDCHTAINDDCFSLKLKNGAVLYLMDICKSVFYKNESGIYARELWMHKPGVGAQFLCSNMDMSPLSSLVDELYLIVKEFSKHPKIKKGLQDIIDAFMVDDFADDSDFGDLPF